MRLALPFSSRQQDGVLYLTLNTPGCEVNVFSAVAAEQLLEILATVNPQRAKAVVIRSSKPGSFINGARLMGAEIIKSSQHMRTLSGCERRAYHAVGDCPVPTIAVVQGMCYGCGVEFTLFCDYTLAVNTGDTCFYMTELNDNLINTGFEGSVRLPLIMGLKPAIDFLLWGARYNARDALHVGLADQVVEHALIQQDIENLLGAIQRSGRWRSHEQRLSKKFRKGADEKIIAMTQGRIATLPPSYQKEYEDCLELAVRSSRKGQMSDRLCRVEVTQCGRSLVKQKGKKALSFFYVRQMARNFCRRGLKPNPVVIQIDASLKEKKFEADLLARWYPGMTFQGNSKLDDPDPSRAIHIVLLEAELGGISFVRQPRAMKVAVSLGLKGRGPVKNADAVLYNPQYATSGRLFELAAKQVKPWLGSLSNVLLRMGYQVLVSQPVQHFAQDLFFWAYLAPLVRYRQLGGTPETINYTLRKFGFVRRPHDLFLSIPVRSMAQLLAPCMGESEGRLSTELRSLREKNYGEGHYDRRLIDALCLSLFATAVRCLDDGTLRHVSLVDLLAREALDFPLMHGSLCKYLNPAQMQTMVRRSPGCKDLITAEDLLLAKEFISKRRRFYL